MLRASPGREGTGRARTFATACSPRRSASWALYRLGGLTNSFIERQWPSPTNWPQQPMAQFWAVGGLRPQITGAVHCQSTQLAAAQPTPWPSISRLVSWSPPPSIVTLSYRTPVAQLSIGPLKWWAAVAEQWTNAFGPAAR